MKLEDFIKKLSVALNDEDTAKGLESFGITTEQVEGLKELKIPATLNEALEIKEIQSEYDKKLAKAADTRETNLKAKYDFKEKEQQQDPNEGKTKYSDPALQALLEKLTEMEKWKEEQEQEKKTQTVEQKRAEFQKNLKDKGIPAVYVHELDLEKDFDSQFETVSKKFEEDGGSFKTEGKSFKPPYQVKTDSKPSKEEISAIVG